MWLLRFVCLAIWFAVCGGAVFIYCAYIVKVLEIVFHEVGACSHARRWSDRLTLLLRWLSLTLACRCLLAFEWAIASHLAINHGRA